MAGGRFSMAEGEFLAEDELVRVVPHFSLEALHFISGTFGPFRRGLPLEVPLWLALKLKADHKCDIQCPEWLILERLQDLYARETRADSASSLQPIPKFFLETSALLFKHAADNIEDIDKARQLVKDIEDFRSEKLRRGRDRILTLARTSGLIDVANLNNISWLESGSLSVDFLPVLSKLSRLAEAEDAARSRLQRAAGPAGVPTFQGSTGRAGSLAPGGALSAAAAMRSFGGGTGSLSLSSSSSSSALLAQAMAGGSDRSALYSSSGVASVADSAGGSHGLSDSDPL